MHTTITPLDAPQGQAALQNCIDALTRGECTEEQFLSEALDLHDPDTDSAWDVLAYIDQRYRRGKLPASLFHSLKSRIAQRVIRDNGAILDRHDGVTVELFPGPATPPAAAEPPARVHPAPAAPAPPSVEVPFVAAVLAAESMQSQADPAPEPVPADAAAAAGPAPGEGEIQVGRILRNRYVVQRFLAGGGMGDVYQAVDGLGVLSEASHARVALKVLRQRSDRRPELMARLQREFDCTRKLSHPNIVKVYEFDRVDGCAFYTMELLQGEHIADLLKADAGRALPRAYAWALIGAIGAAIAHAHARNVVHGDVSTKNIMITRTGEVRVLDFGSSTMSNGVAVPAELEVKGAVAATPAYASCEVLEGRKPEPRDDLYSLACIAYELVAGEHPFQGRRSSEARDLGLRPRRPSGLTLRQWRTVQRGLAWSREGRSMTVRQWLAQLGLEPEPDCLPPLPPPPPLPVSTGAAALSGRVRPGGGLGFMAPAAGLIAVLILAWHLYHRAGATGTPAAPAPPEASASAPTRAPRPPAAPLLLEPPALAEMPRVNPPPPAPVAVQAALPANRAASAAARRGAPTAMGFLADRYHVGARAHFVEAHVWRSRRNGDPNGFIWWTTNASAHAGIDYVAQAPTPRAFGRGRTNVALFIRLLPNPERTQGADFKVCMGQPGNDRGPTGITCSSILLPASGPS